MASSTNTPSSASAIAGFVEPLRAGAAILGFAVGFLATYRSGGALPEATIHGLVGALLLGPVGWFLGLVLISQGYEPGDQLHFVYGLLPLLCVAYPYALRGEDGRRNLLVFTIGSALVAALGIRAFMTGPH